MAAGAIPLVGAYHTLWLSLGIVAVASLIGAFAIREAHANRPLVDTSAPDFSVARELLRGIDIIGRQPKIAVGAVVRVINNTSYFGFFVFLPFFLTERAGLTTSQYLLVFTTMGLVGIAVDPFIGKISDRLGWRRTVGWIGGVGSALGCLLLYLVPAMLPGNYVLICAVAGFFGAVLAGYIPLSAMMTSAVDTADKGNAMASYSLAAGLCTFTGPALYSLFGSILGYGGIAALYAALHLVGALLTFRYLHTAADPERSPQRPSRSGQGQHAVERSMH